MKLLKIQLQYCNYIHQFRKISHCNGEVTIYWLATLWQFFLCTVLNLIVITALRNSIILSYSWSHWNLEIGYLVNIIQQVINRDKIQICCWNHLTFFTNSCCLESQSVQQMYDGVGAKHECLGKNTACSSSRGRTVGGETNSLTERVPESQANWNVVINII